MLPSSGGVIQCENVANISADERTQHMTLFDSDKFRYKMYAVGVLVAWRLCEFKTKMYLFPTPVLSAALGGNSY